MTDTPAAPRTAEANCRKSGHDWHHKSYEGTWLCHCTICGIVPNRAARSTPAEPTTAPTLVELDRLAEPLHARVITREGMETMTRLAYEKGLAEARSTPAEPLDAIIEWWRLYNRSEASIYRHESETTDSLETILARLSRNKEAG